jgi:glycine/D-amino acid oxidase-like deaminating enzyme/nitrite reductase/ring-hydroxylating ferredoxin subunit
MKPPDGIHKPNWYDAAPPVPVHAPPPAGELQADVCVVGAGIAGLTAAYLLASAGRSVIVLDEGPIASGQTGRTTAHLASYSDDQFIELERMHGTDNARLWQASNAAAIDFVERISADVGIECEFARLDAYLFPLPSDPPDLLDRELAATKRCGLHDAERLDRVTLCGYETGPCLRLPRQARFQPIKYMVGLAGAIEQHGGRIFVGNRVTDVQGAQRGGPVVVTAGATTVRAKAAVVATNTPAPISDWVGIYTKQAAYRTYVIGATVPRGVVTDALYWDTGDPYHYVRLEANKDRADHDLLVVGGEDHKTGQHQEGHAPFLRLETWAREKFPMVGDVVSRWSGQVQEPSDYLPFIGKAPTKGSDVYVITGDSGMGTTHGTLGAMLVTDLIVGRSNPWTTLYDPSRKTPDLDWVKENVNVAAQFKDYVTPGEIASADELRPGQGALMRSGLTKVCVYRDDAGTVHKCSAVCTHLKCIVQWNDVEKSWDCPCHGSRFDPTGRVLMGPATTDLPPVPAASS